VSLRKLIAAMLSGNQVGNVRVLHFTVFTSDVWIIVEGFTCSGAEFGGKVRRETTDSRIFYPECELSFYICNCWV
jgi:hypothetical protein